MTIELVTGVPGAGKTLYTLSKKVRPLVGKKIRLDDVLDSATGQPVEVERRIMVCGVRDLLLPHEIVDVAPSHDPWDASQRPPGHPPLDVPCMVQNWWLWCQPGDVIVIDECQRVFRPSAAGQKIPAFIRHLETHRHYGVDFILVTQHPQLIHANVRNLIGHHEHVRRIFGGAGTMVYEWDHCTHPDRTKQASGRLWRHDKSAFGLYKSAEVHTKVKHKIPGAVMVAAAGFLALPVMGYQVFARMDARFNPDALASDAETSPDSPLGAPLLPADQKTPEATPRAALSVNASASAVAGCIASKTTCRCVDSNGEWLTTQLEACQWNAENLGGWIKYSMAPIPSYSRRAPPAPETPASGVVRSVPGPAEVVQDVAPVMSAFADGHIRR